MAVGMTQTEASSENGGSSSITLWSWGAKSCSEFDLGSQTTSLGSPAVANQGKYKENHIKSHRNQIAETQG